jgi:hypothetical protein
MKVNIPEGYALIVSSWGYHVTRFRMNLSGKIRFETIDDLGDGWKFNQYHAEYDVYYEHDGVNLWSVHVIACSTSVEEIVSTELPHPNYPFSGISRVVPDILLSDLAELIERPEKHAEFARKREVICSGPILYKAFLETKSVSAAQEFMLSKLTSSPPFS